MAIHQLSNFPRAHQFFVGVDSDGCAFDTMEIKHKECFIPNTINYWDLQPVSRFAREASEFVNLYSQWRGLNRFPALTMTFDVLAEHPAAVQRGYKPPQCDSLRDWIKRETALSADTLRKVVAAGGDAVLKRALDWCDAVNADIEKIVRNVPPFPFVRQGLEKLSGVADVIVVSATPYEALQREWAEHGLAGYASMICGQEQGSKREHIRHCAGGKYDADHVLMVGDALGDYRAAKDNNALFYPINPGSEAESWQRLLDEAIGRFTAGTYRGAYEDALVEDFRCRLPTTPPWKKH